MSDTKVKDILHAGACFLSRYNIENYRFDAEILLEFIIKKRREFLIAHPYFCLSEEQISAFWRCLRRRADNYSCAAIIGIKTFYGYEFVVSNSVLIPRPETEILVDEALKQIVNNRDIEIVFDVGTGSGCIIISVFNELKKQKNKNIASFYGLDISQSALHVASQNADKHNAQEVKFIHSDLLGYFLKQKVKFRNILILANLPYLTPHEIINSPSIQKEPMSALDGGEDGLAHYFRLIMQIKEIIEDGGRGTVYMEISPWQAVALKRKIGESLDGVTVDTIKDFSGRERIIKLFNNPVLI